ncbi:hypothetical protein BY458DRAFT_560441 [Sporodiniella umbellata]|nr:hypothetical protein BY458DRAFT_560441 [Sporodiniella umbellata]
MESRLAAYSKVLDIGIVRSNGCFVGMGYAALGVSASSTNSLIYKDLQRIIPWDDEDGYLRSVYLQWDEMPPFCQAQDHCRTDYPQLKNIMQCFNCKPQARKSQSESKTAAPRLSQREDMGVSLGYLHKNTPMEEATQLIQLVALEPTPHLTGRRATKESRERQEPHPIKFPRTENFDSLSATVSQTKASTAYLSKFANKSPHNNPIGNPGGKKNGSQSSGVDILVQQETHAGDMPIQKSLNLLFHAASSIWISHCGILSKPPLYHFSYMLSYQRTVHFSRHHLFHSLQQLPPAILKSTLTSTDNQHVCPCHMLRKKAVSREFGSSPLPTEFGIQIRLHFLPTEPLPNICSKDQNLVNSDWTDHALSQITLTTEHQDLGEGSWKANHFLAKNEHFQQALQSFLHTKFGGLETAHETMQAELLWDEIKNEV